MKMAARAKDACTHIPPALTDAGSTDVSIQGRGAWRALDDKHACKTPVPPPPAHGNEIVVMGSMTVLINNRMASRASDLLIGLNVPNSILTGCPTVRIGDIPFGLADPANIDEF